MTARKVLVTGSSGLIGRALVSRLRVLGADATGVSRGAEASHGLLRADLADATSAATILERVSPTVIVHLAGAVTGDLATLCRANVETTRNLFEAVAQLDPAPAVIVAGSAAEYGDPITDRISEDHPTHPVTDYGRTKVLQSTIAQQIATAAGLSFCILRPFNIVSNDLPPTVALGNIRRQLFSGSGPLRTIQCGRLDVVRDFIALEFVVETIVTLLELDEWPPVLNVCSGMGTRLGDLVRAIASALDVEIDPQIDPQLAAIAAAPRVVGDPTRLGLLGLQSQPDATALAEVLVAPWREPEDVAL